MVLRQRFYDLSARRQQTWRIVITTDTGTATTRGLHLSLEAMTWFETLPGTDVH